MPIYEYRCAECGEIFEEIGSVGASSPACPACGRPETERIISAPGAPKKRGFPFKIGPVHPLAKKMVRGNACSGSCPGSASGDG